MGVFTEFYHAPYLNPQGLSEIRRAFYIPVYLPSEIRRETHQC